MNLNQFTLPVRDIPKATAGYRHFGCLQIVNTLH